MADQGIVEMEKQNHELQRENLEMKERFERLCKEVEEMRSEEVGMKQRIEEMEKEIEEYEEEKMALEAVSTRAVELESEVTNLQEEWMSSLGGVDKVGEEVRELKKVLGEKEERLEGCEKEAEGLRKERDEVESKVREMERKIGVMEVREMEEKSRRVRLEEEMRERVDEKEREVKELEKRVGVLSLELVKNVEELDKCKAEKKLTEEALSEAGKREKEMELKKDELVKKVEEGKEKVSGLNERSRKSSNGVRETEIGEQKGTMKAEFQWPVVAAGSIGTAGLVAATVFVCYSKRR